MNLGSFGLNRTGHDGGAGRENNYNSAKNYFCQFLQSEYVKLMAEDDESDFDTWVRNNEGTQSAICDVEVIQQFASWLCHHAKKSEKYYRSEPLALRSILDMLSSTKSIFNKIFPSNTIFTGNAEQPWYTKLRSKSSQEVTRRDMKRGVISLNKAKPLGREQIRNVLQILFSVNTFTSIRKAVYVGTTFNSAGRSGECAYTCIDNGTYWDYDEEKLYMAQKEIKVAEEKTITMYRIMNIIYWISIGFFSSTTFVAVDLNSLDRTTDMVILSFQNYTIRKVGPKDQHRHTFRQY